MGYPWVCIWCYYEIVLLPDVHSRMMRNDYYLTMHEIGHNMYFGWKLPGLGEVRQNWELKHNV